MTRYADPHRCPDCLGAIAGQDTCPHCGLPLRGELAQRLFTTLSTADGLLAALRAARAPTSVAEPAESGAAGSAAPPPASASVRGGLSAASVPKILLGLGAACVLVAALVFLAVTWSRMGVGGRTATLVGFTAVSAALAGWSARRALRGAAEALSLVALGLLTLDVFGADNAGWLGDLTVSAFVVVLGAVLAGAGTAAALAVRRTPVRDLAGAEVVAVIGVGLVATGVASSELLPDSPGLVLAVVAAALAAVGALQLDLRILTVGAGVVAGLGWIALLGEGLERALRHDTLRELWLGLHAWPLVAAAALVSGLAVARLPRAARVLAATAGYAVLTVVVLVPVVAAEPTEAAYAVLLVLFVNSALSWYGPRRWRLVPAMSTGLLVAWVLALGVPTAAIAADRMPDLAGAAWAGDPSDRLSALVADGDLMAPWLLPVCVLALVVAVLALAEAEPAVDQWVGSLLDLRVGVALVALAAVGALASYAVPVWVVPAAFLVVALGFLAWWWRRGQSPVPLVLAGLFLAAGVVVGWYAEVLTEAALVVALAVSVLVHLRSRSSDVAAVAGTAGAAVVAGLGWTTGALLDAAHAWTALGTLLALALVALPLAWLPDRWWRCAPAPARVGVEVGAAAAAVPVGLAGVLLAEPGSAATWAAVYLTVAGVAVSGTALLRRDRQLLGWPGGLLLATASWVRLWDVGVREPEAYTLPSAAALGVVGLLTLRRRPGTATLPALSPALGLALLPSLLWALAEPPGVRALLLGLGCLALVLGGVRLRWTAPVLYGAAVGGLLVLRLAAPYVEDAVPRWLLLGAAGALLIAVGVTWEARLRDARQVMGYVRALR